MADADMKPTHNENPSGEPRLALTPAGVLFAFSQPEPDDIQARLQTILSAQALPTVSAWTKQAPGNSELLVQGVAAGWLHRLHQNMPTPDVKLSDFLSHIIASLSGERKAALAATGGFCVGHCGYLLEEAEALCAAAADFSEFARRQRARGWQGASYMASFHEDIAMLMPKTSFVPFWIDGTDFCLILAGEPLLNNPTFVELIWVIKTSGARYSGTP